MEESYVLKIKKQHERHSEFYLCYCGCAECKPLHSFGPAIRPNYIIHIVLEGKGRYYVGDQCYKLEKGQGFVIMPNMQTTYTADQENPWKYVWVGFNGERCGEYLQEFGINESHLIFQTNYLLELKEIVVEMLQHGKVGSYHEFFHQGLLCHFFAYLAKDLYVEVPAEGNERKSYYVREAVEYIRNNYVNEITVADVADYVCINRSYLTTLFKNELGMSPQEYLMNFRITRGMELLSTTETTIENIAASCGYKNPLVFSKAFKKVNGMSPSQYRKNSDNNKPDIMTPLTF